MLFRALRDAGLRPGGFCVKRVYRRAMLDGMDMIDLATGRRARMLSVACVNGDGLVFAVNPGAFLEIGVPSIVAALDMADVVVMDELGRFECEVPEFTSCVFAALDAAKPVVGVLKDETNPFLDMVRARHDVRVVNLRPESREEASREFRRLLCSLLEH